ncbi:hypothetical protein K505DRAFT_322592 [Melanomma pulvis-pyrius CBS 109.77]|uniref:Uncharacterized protein n=1 Tax=Melanomma pulvis-pyrius CBS 109.77 TaxID=1314802 RepID=A0A6A6XMK5_9PLEO|nr:hypothetical protein K505DRAFT_322592 [Melanomma pulvis-pyrius CBS 109.77]
MGLTQGSKRYTATAGYFKCSHGFTSYHSTFLFAHSISPYSIYLLILPFVQYTSSLYHEAKPTYSLSDLPDNP